MLDPESIPRLMTAGTIEVAPLAYMRGRTLNDAFIILDEAQNTTAEQMKMFLTRLGFSSKMVVTGDVTQTDLPGGTRSGLNEVQDILGDMDDVAFLRLTSSDVVRHRLVSDIVDAMLLAGLLEALLRHGVLLVVTSNTSPSALYRDGLQRERFLPAIALLERELEVLQVDGGVDYRLRRLQRSPIYLDSRAADSAAQLQSLFDDLAGDHGDSALELRIGGRRLRALRRRGDVVWFSFATLCQGPRSAVDYAEIAADFHTVLLSDVPAFTAPQQDNEARRFVALIDEFYDQGVKLVLSAAAAPAELYRGELLQFEFRRTASRLAEMQTQYYLGRPRRT